MKAEETHCLQKEIAGQNTLLQMHSVLGFQEEEILFSFPLNGAKSMNHKQIFFLLMKAQDDPEHSKSEKDICFQWNFSAEMR